MKRLLLLAVFLAASAPADTLHSDGSGLTPEGAALAAELARVRDSGDSAVRAALEQEIAAFSRALETLNVMNDPNRSLDQIVDVLRQYAPTAAPEDRAAVETALGAAEKLQERLASLSGSGRAPAAAEARPAMPANDKEEVLPLAALLSGARALEGQEGLDEIESEELGRVTRLARLLLRRLSEIATDLVAEISAVVGNPIPADRFRLPTKLASVLALRDKARAKAPLTKADHEVAFGALVFLALAGGAALPAAFFLLLGFWRRKPERKVEDEALAA